MKILLVESSGGDADRLKMSLAQKDYTSVDRVRNGGEALDYLLGQGKFKKTPLPDILLLDLSLPNTGGTDLLRALKENPALSFIPVIVLASSSNPRDYSECHALGVSSFLTKPFGKEGYEVLITQLVRFEFPRLVPMSHKSRAAGRQ